MDWALIFALNVGSAILKIFSRITSSLEKIRNIFLRKAPLNAILKHYIMAAEECSVCKNVLGINEGYKIGFEGIQRKNLGLLAAAYVGHKDCVETFIEQGADVNCADCTFDLDCRRNIGSGVRYTSRYGYSRTLTDPFTQVAKSTPLFYAAALGHIEIIKSLLKEGANVNLAISQRTALSMAAERGQHGSVKCLIEAEANVNIFSEHIEPILISAARFHKISDSEKCIDLLIEAGADVNIQCFDPRTGQTTPLLECIKLDIPKIVSKLIGAGADVNLGYGGKFPLHEALGDKHFKCAELLIEAGADVNQQNDYSETPMYRAARALQNEAVDLLVKSGADVNTPDNRGMTPLMIAAMMSSRQLDCDGNSRKQIISFEKTYIDIFYNILRGGARVNNRDEMGRNALQIAISSYRTHYHKKDLFLMLYVPGETLDGPTITTGGAVNIKIPECIKELQKNLDLKHLCREAIRKHLIDLDPHQHLFGRIPKLGLPSIVNDYLLYGRSLEEAGDDDDDGDDDYYNDESDDDDDDDYYDGLIRRKRQCTH